MPVHRILKHDDCKIPGKEPNSLIYWYGTCLYVIIHFIHLVFGPLCKPDTTELRYLCKLRIYYFAYV